MIKFSVIVPVYNSEEWLDKCFSSILNQTYTNYEVIIVDDISEDNGIKIIRNYEKLFKEKGIKCKVIINKSKRLNGGSRNVAIMECNSDYTIAIDCDDWLIDNYVLENLAKDINGEDIIFLGCKMQTKEFLIDSIPVYNTWEEALKGNLVALWTKCTKTSFLKQCLSKEGTLFEDLGHHYRMLCKTKNIKSLGRATHIWNRLNEKSTMTRKDYSWYRFNFCGEIYELIQNTEDEELRGFFIEVLNLYFNSLKEMVGELNGKSN